MPDQDPRSVKMSLAATNGAMQKVRIMHLPLQISSAPTHVHTSPKASCTSNPLLRFACLPAGEHVHPLTGKARLNQNPATKRHVVNTYQADYNHRVWAMTTTLPRCCHGRADVNASLRLIDCGKLIVRPVCG